MQTLCQGPIDPGYDSSYMPSSPLGVYVPLVTCIYMQLIMLLIFGISGSFNQYTTQLTP